ncbi:ABC transporter permease [Erysipelotrichaceae bacterium]|nr:ABC transporter permease [Erysipelotrichaceae bacterium]
MALFKLQFKNQWKMLIVWIIACAVTLVLLMAIFPSMQTTGLKEFVMVQASALPENLMKIVNLEDMKKLLEVTGFFAYLFQYIFMAAAIFATMLGARCLVLEQTEGTIEYLYGQPLSRSDIFFGKVAANITMIALFWLTLFIVSVASLLLFNGGTEEPIVILQKLLQVFTYELLMLVLFFMIGISASVLINSSAQVAGISMGVVFGTYILGIVAQIQPNLSFLENLSPVHIALPGKLLVGGVDLPQIIGSLLLISLLFILSLTYYKVKDFRI